jgi:hypothetical protein
MHTFKMTLLSLQLQWGFTTYLNLKAPAKRCLFTDGYRILFVGEYDQVNNYSTILLISPLDICFNCLLLTLLVRGDSGSCVMAMAKFITLHIG